MRRSYFTLKIIVFCVLLSFTLVGCINPFMEQLFNTLDKSRIYTVTFDSKGGSEVPNQSVAYGGTAVRPSNPLLRDFNFVNWYLNADLTGSPYNFDTPVTRNLTLYAKWNESTDIPITSVEFTILPPVKNMVPHTSAEPAVGHFIIGTVTWSPAHNPFLGGIEYTATVTLTANTGYTFTGLSSVRISGQDGEIVSNTGRAITVSHTFPATLTKDVTDMTIKSYPTQLNYTHGDPLNLDGLVVTLTYDNNPTDYEDVPAASFAGYNIATEPEHGDHLVHTAHDGHPVTVIYGNLHSDTNNLIVSPKVMPFAVDPIPAQTYTGSGLEPAVIVRDGATILTLHTDYTVAYTNNTNAGTADVEISGAGNYAGSSGSAIFTISPQPISHAEFTIFPPVKSATPHTTADTESEQFTIGTVSWSPDHNPFLGETVYTATVTLTAKSNYTFTGLSSVHLNGQDQPITDNTGTTITVSHTFPATEEKDAIAMTIQSQPTQLIYYDGSQLNLDGLVVRLTYDDGTSADIAAANFAAKNIVTEPGQGDHLTMADNGKPITIIHSSLRPTTNNLTINLNPIAFNITFNQIADNAPSITGPTLYRVTSNDTDRPASATLTVAGQYDSISWRVNDKTGIGASFELNAADYLLGEYFVTVLVIRNSVPYSKTVSFWVEY